MGFEDLLAGWEGEHAVVRYDAESAAWMFVCVHSTALGPAGGGTRMRVYPTPADGLADAMRLSGAMTWKMAGAGMPRGGGKAVLAVPELPLGEPRKRLLRRYGELVASLGGSYRTAGDMNISPEDLDVVAETCPWVYGTTSGGGNSGRGTARGALHAIRATVEHLFGSPELSGRSVLVQGAGSVGAVLARELADAGARVLASDVDESRAADTGCETVPPDRVLETEVDVYSPCAVGGILDADSIPRLACRAVAGCANNQLAEPEDADRLHERGILYAPDYVVNAGGIIQLIGLEDEGWDEVQLEARLAGIGDTLRTLFAEAAAAGITPAEAADRLVRRRLSAKAAGSQEPPAGI
ncbi:MAG TPA: Glu/Leu/Phe/Val dehydrogenase dimerization domain-containing protein [Gaiellaceae bacterium]|nr:Glu/Leu/Phe/Val dehydrogenase dimerization domain-containing protein [Gaiellaceae bacterium]